ncbi:MAG: GNAT family N-acetyltransferase [Flavobacteriaceae bacterium]|nr:GNAT family N-acetyltransferase [Flavobacteriaceae bacterium]
MIQKLNHKNHSIAEKMLPIFHASYAVEGKLLQAVDFPPLQRQISDYMNTDTVFFGFWEEKELAGVVELHIAPKQVHIQSLVVDPNYFRRGIGRKLVQFVFGSFSSELFMVETGAANGPAIALYESFGFEELLQWNTSHGIRKVRFEKKT